MGGKGEGRGDGYGVGVGDERDAMLPFFASKLLIFFSIRRKLRHREYHTAFGGGSLRTTGTTTFFASTRIFAILSSRTLVISRVCSSQHRGLAGCRGVASGREKSPKRGSTKDTTTTFFFLPRSKPECCCTRRQRNISFSQVADAESGITTFSRQSNTRRQPQKPPPILSRRPLTLMPSPLANRLLFLQDLHNVADSTRN